MGCPPDPIEVSIWRSSERIELMQQKYDRLLSEYHDAARLASDIGADSVIQRADFTRQEFQRHTDIRPTDFDQYADAADQHRIEQECTARVKELETALCELRTQLLRLPVAGLSGETLRRWKTERARHLAHRREDRAQWLLWLEERVKLLRFLLENRGNRVDEPAAKAMIVAIKAEIRRVKKLSDDELLADRAVLRADERRWATPYLAESGFD